MEFDALNRRQRDESTGLIRLPLPLNVQQQGEAEPVVDQPVLSATRVPELLEASW